MKHKIKSIIFVLAIMLMGTSHTLETQQSEELSPYYRVAVYKSNISAVSSKVKTALKSKNFNVVGSYTPGNNNNLKVIAFTRSDLKSTVIKVKDRGALASVLKVGIYKKGDLIYVSIINPTYIFNAYLRNDYPKYSTALNKVHTDLLEAMATIGKKAVPFGGSESAKGLRSYHYMMGMPYFKDAVELKTFNSFDEAVKTINKNLTSKKGNTVKVYQINYPASKVAVFGIGLLNKSDGESHFLPIIGENHVAAMPYEIIVQGNTASMLHGRYRIALHWPELTMGTFTKIMSTPGDIEDAFSALME